MAKIVTPRYDRNSIKIKVVGVGNAGGNIISRISDKIEGVDFIVFNTEDTALKRAKANIKILIGEKTTHGRGTGKNPDKGKFAANEDKEKIVDVLKNSEIVFLTAGLGGGTGTGSSPIIAKIAKDLGAIVIAIVTTPFNFEGEKLIGQAQEGLIELEKNIDTLIHIPNERLSEILTNTTPMVDAFKKVDEIVCRTISSISDLINKPNVILDIDFADICAIIENAGRGMIGLGYGKGEGKVEKSARSAIEDPLLEKNEIMEAKNVLISITGCPELSIQEVEDAMEIIQTRISSTSRVLGVTIDNKLQDEVKITLLATGIGKIKSELKKEIHLPKEESELFIGGEEIIDIPPALREKGRFKTR